MLPLRPSWPSPLVMERASILPVAHQQNAAKVCAVAEHRADIPLVPDSRKHPRCPRESDSSSLRASSVAASGRYAPHPLSPRARFDLPMRNTPRQESTTPETIASEWKTYSRCSFTPLLYHTVPQMPL